MHENCEACTHMTTFVDRGNEGSILHLCTAEPYDDDDKVTWLDVNDFNSDECMLFLRRKKI
jgi:hypothetical protein